MSNDDIQELEGRIVALEIICALIINQFARNPSLRSSIADAIIVALSKIPDGPGVHGRAGFSHTNNKIADDIVRYPIE